ncbi:type II toxin-antitoxin system RelE/ParE family toxin [Methylobacterium oxalidis]|uniref:Killer protein n=1 Tax=Methylobacterium oxalidis TaxID=944322 RepID=A0A512IZ33_9HYPH|nr:type II toxin-antitoxin system RelE/ParE family toxin [Methylobacterium oxalidis]GEP02923.1 killer protein [Methylobacterium oxalidis]GJE30290.1 hypothetical protein LDDCCGHA_0457 [Methylobacterium oxalidis]GLS65856.1 killer protein [Methylobacterium oxalidis]
MIRSFRCAETRALHDGGRCRKTWEAFRTVAPRKLDMLDAADEFRDLRSPPGNRLGKLSGDRDGQWSIRINDQWRLCFRWGATGPEDVEIVDDH